MTLIKPKKIILIIIDTLRADHLGCYGYKRNTSPNIDALARENILFKHAFSPSPHGITSYGSIFTSKYPSNHSLGFDRKGKLNTKIDVTLASILNKNNYKTAAFVSDKVLSKERNFNDGFDIYNDDIESEPFGKRDCQRTNQQVFKWLEENYLHDFFLFIHYFDAHGPYLNQEPYKNMFVEDEFYGSSEVLQDIFDLNPTLNSIPRYQILNPKMNENNNLLDYEKDVRYYKAQYDGCIRYIDEKIGELIGKLKELNIYDDTLMIITADHGEAFGENNIFLYHGLSVTLEQIAVPLILKLQKGWDVKSKNIDTLVSTIDITPTILSLCGYNYSEIGIAGYSLKKILEDRNDPILKERTIISENENQFALIYPNGLLELKKKDTLASINYPSILILIDSLQGKKYYWDSGTEYLLTIPFDQYQRYKIISDIINKFRDAKQIFKILDVGASFEGNLKRFLPHDNIYFLDKEYPIEYIQRINYIVGDITRIELSETYDFVISIDTYEHINPVDRERFIDKLLSLSKLATIIAAPFDTQWVREHEVFANEVFRISHGTAHKWLHEHIQNGLPSLPYTLEIIKRSGLNFIIIPNGYLPRWFEMISIYLLTEGMAEFSKYMEELYEFYNKNFYCYDNLDPAYRQVIIVSKINANPSFSDIYAKNSEPNDDFSYKSKVLQSFFTKINELSGDFRYKELTEKREQITELTITLNRLTNDLQAKEIHIRNLEAQLQSMRQSITWQIVMRYNKLMEILLPYGTRRYRYYDVVLREFRAILNRGWSSLWQEFKIGSKISISKKKLLNPLKINHPQIIFKVKDVVSSLSDPLLSVVILENIFNVNSLDSIYQSIDNQTLNSLEIVSYSEKAKRITVWKKGKYDSRVSRECGSYEMMTAMLTGLYVYAPTEHFVLFPETFLESNVIALAAEDIHFTINFFGTPKEILSLQLSKENIQDVLFVRKDLATFEAMRLSILKFKTFIENTTGKVAGRWVIQPKIENNTINNSISLSDAFGIDEIEFITTNRHIIPMRSRGVSPSLIEHYTRPIDQIFQEKANKNQKPMIMVFMPFLAIGGAEKLTIDILLRIKDQFDFVIVTVESTDPSIGEQSQMFRKVTPLIYHMAEFSTPQLILSNTSYLIKKYNIKILFVANGANWFYDEVINIKKNFPNLKIINQVYDHKHGWINRITPNISQAIDMHIAVNKSIESTYQEKGIPDNKIRLIYHGIDLSEFDSSNYNPDSINILKEKLALPKDHLIVSFIARFHPQKRPIDFLRLAKHMEKDERFFFVMVGDGSLSNEVNRFIETHKLSNLKRFPFYEPIADILSMTDILIITSEYEGLPLILLDAQAMAVPVVSTNVGCIAEVITTGENGILVKKIGDIDSFERGLLTLAKVKDRKSWGLRGRERVASNFNIDKVAKAYRNVLGES